LSKFANVALNGSRKGEEYREAVEMIKREGDYGQHHGFDSGEMKMEEAGDGKRLMYSHQLRTEKWRARVHREAAKEFSSQDRRKLSGGVRVAITTEEVAEEGGNWIRNRDTVKPLPTLDMANWSTGDVLVTLRIQTDGIMDSAERMLHGIRAFLLTMCRGSTTLPALCLGIEVYMQSSRQIVICYNQINYRRHFSTSRVAIRDFSSGSIQSDRRLFQNEQH
jgi:hypothetical protein